MYVKNLVLDNYFFLFNINIVWFMKIKYNLKAAFLSISIKKYVHILLRKPSTISIKIIKFYDIFQRNTFKMFAINFKDMWNDKFKSFSQKNSHHCSTPLPENDHKVVSVCNSNVLSRKYNKGSSIKCIVYRNITTTNHHFVLFLNV